MVGYGFHCKECSWADKVYLSVFKTQLYGSSTNSVIPSEGFQVDLNFHKHLQR